ncbi:MAG: acyl-CoA thioesterase [Cyclobacteriaceae bacterium]
MDFRPSKHSEIIITELMIPSYANFGGKIHGGILLSMMDKAAYACATKHSGMYCVTVAIDNVVFKNPVEVGELVSMKAKVNYVGRSSMEIGIRVEAENVKKGIVKHTNTSYFLMVAKDDNDNPAEVPGLILETKDEVRRFIEALSRRQFSKKMQENMLQSKNHPDLENEMKRLENQRCEIKL